MAVNPFPYHWGLEEFLHAWEGGAFTERTELIDGEVWDVPIGEWHAETTGSVMRALPNGRFRILAGSLPAGQSLPEPGCWVRRSDATPVEQLSPRMKRWAAPDVVLVVEVFDETHDFDVAHKARIYADAGFAVYWSVTREGVHVHSDPSPTGYHSRSLVGPGGQVTVPYAPDVTLAVDDLLAPGE
jgi:Putative restriction endonuclease